MTGFVVAGLVSGSLVMWASRQLRHSGSSAH
jgi:hypothetical protein